LILILQLLERRPHKFMQFIQIFTLNELQNSAWICGDVTENIFILFYGKLCGFRTDFL